MGKYFLGLYRISLCQIHAQPDLAGFVNSNLDLRI